MKKTALVVALSLGLWGCNDPFTQAKQDVDNLKKAAQQLSKLSTYLTNSPLANFTGFSEAWITLHKVEIRNTTTNTTSVLFEDATGKSVNITRRDGIAELLSLTQIDTGQYDQIVVTVGNDMRIVLSDGSTITPNLGSAATYDISVPVNLNVTQNNATGFALQFDLASFVPNAQNQVLNPIINFIADTTVFQRLYGELKGTVSAVDLVGRNVTVTLADGTVLTLQIPTFATLLNDANGLLLTLADLKIGDIVQFFGNYNGNQLRMEILSLLINPQAVDQGAQATLCSSSRVQTEGKIVSYDNTTLVLDLEEASFLPDSDNINVINLSGATYMRGSASMLSPGLEVEIRGSWDCSNLNAELVEIDDAPSNSEIIGSGNSGELSEVKGNITAATGSQITLTTTSSEHFSLAIGSSLTVDLANAWYKKGNASCLVAGTAVDLKGMEPADQLGTMQVSTVEIDGCSSGTLPDNTTFDNQNGTQDETGMDTSTAGNDFEGGEINESDSN